MFRAELQPVEHKKLYVKILPAVERNLRSLSYIFLGGSQRCPIVGL